MVEQLQLSHLDREHFQGFTPSIAKTPEELEEVKKFDDSVFGGHQLIELEELERIAANGYLLVLKDDTGTIAAESQLLLSPIVDHPSLTTDEAYVYGIGVRQDIQSRGVAGVLHHLHESIAQAATKSRITLTVRVENAASIRSFIKHGYTIVGYNPTCYGSFEEGGARLIMQKDMRHIPEQQRTQDTIHPLNRPVSDLYLPPTVKIPVNVGDTTDPQAHVAIAEALSQGYKGTNLLKPDDGGKLSLFIFSKM